MVINFRKFTQFLVHKKGLIPIKSGYIILKNKIRPLLPQNLGGTNVGTVHHASAGSYPPKVPIVSQAVTWPVPSLGRDRRIWRLFWSVCIRPIEMPPKKGTLNLYKSSKHVEKKRSWYILILVNESMGLLKTYYISLLFLSSFNVNQNGPNAYIKDQE